MFPNPYTNTTWMREEHPILLEIARELENLDCKCIETPDFPSLYWIFTNRQSIDILHVHWPEHYYEYAWRPDKSLFVRLTRKFGCGLSFQHLLGFLWLFSFVHLLKILKIPLVWTLHELYPHSSHIPSSSQIFFRKYLFRHTLVLLLNCQGILPLVQENFGNPRYSIVTPLGDYKSFYSNTINREDARSFFNIKETENMLLFFGNQRPHRNALELVHSFKEISNPSAILWIIGNTPDPIRSEIEILSWGDWRIHLYLRHADNHQVVNAIRACDFLVMPGEEYLTSAVIALALSHGIPVIAPRYGCAVDMVRDAGILFDDTQTTGLRKALEYALENKDLLQEAARQQVPRWTWELTAKQTKKAYQLAIDMNKM